MLKNNTHGNRPFGAQISLARTPVLPNPLRFHPEYLVFGLPETTLGGGIGGSPCPLGSRSSLIGGGGRRGESGFSCPFDSGGSEDALAAASKRPLSCRNLSDLTIVRSC